MNHKITLLFILLISISISYLNFSPADRQQTQNDPDKMPTQGDKDDPYAAARFRWEMVTGGNTDVDPIQLRQKAISKTIEMNAQRKVSKITDISWSPVGPGNIGGRIRAIIINPANSAEMLIGSVSGGIWKTTNGGSSWSPKLDTQDPIAIGCMILVGSSTVYAGTGEGWWNVDAVYGGGIYKSTDFGETWNILPSTIGANIWNFRNVLRMDSDPSGNIYAVTKAYNYKGNVGGYYANGGLYRSADDGSTWTKISSTDQSTNFYAGTDVIAISPTIILFPTDSKGIYRTTDGGATWALVTGTPSTGFNRIALARDPNSSSIFYAVFATSNTNPPYYGLRGIYKSTNSGANWSSINSPPPLSSTGGSYLSAQGWYDNVIAVDPFNSSNIYAGGVEIVKSTDGGTNWNQLTYWDPYYGSPYVHADHHVISFDPNNSGVVYSGNDGGIYKTTNSGSSWTPLNNSLEITQFYGGAVYPTGLTYYGGTQDNGHLKYTSGTSWIESEGGDGGYAAQDQTNSQISYEEYVYLRMERTTDGGTSWTTCTSGLSDAGNSSASLFIAPFSMNPENSNVLIAGSDNVWITSNSAGGWTSSSNTLVSGENISAVTVVNAAVNYLGFAGTTNGSIFKCTNLNPGVGTDTWTDITPPGNNGAWVRRIVVDLNDKNRIFACYSGFNNNGSGKHIWFSSDQGTSWNDKSLNLPDIPVHSLVIDPFNSNVLYIGTETGVYQTTDNGTSWSSFNLGMPSFVPTDELVLQTGTNNLFAFTHGRGVWKTTSPLPVELSSFTASVKNEFIQLDWRTETEVNNYGFEVYRKSANDTSWTKLGFIEGHGNSNVPNDYTYTDKEFAYGKSEYKLKQIDNNGRFQYSDIVEVDAGQMPSAFILQQNYPNPFNPATKIKFSVKKTQNVQLKVYDVTGRLVTTLFNGNAESDKNYKLEFDGKSYASGIYIYSLESSSFNSSRKMLLLK